MSPCVRCYHNYVHSVYRSGCLTRVGKNVKTSFHLQPRSNPSQLTRSKPVFGSKLYDTLARLGSELFDIIYGIIQFGPQKRVQPPRMNLKKRNPYQMLLTINLTGPSHSSNFSPVPHDKNCPLKNSQLLQQTVLKPVYRGGDAIGSSVSPASGSLCVRIPAATDLNRKNR